MDLVDVVPLLAALYFVYDWKKHKHKESILLSLLGATALVVKVFY